MSDREILVFYNHHLFVKKGPVEMKIVTANILYPNLNKVIQKLELTKMLVLYPWKCNKSRQRNIYLFD